MKKGQYILFGAVISLFLLLSGCAGDPLKPWERGHLARGDMQGSPDALEATLRDHVFFSKEGSSGSASSGGGGCGCN